MSMQISERARELRKWRNATVRRERGSSRNSAPESRPIGIDSLCEIVLIIILRKSGIPLSTKTNHFLSLFVQKFMSSQALSMGGSLLSPMPAQGALGTITEQPHYNNSGPPTLPSFHSILNQPPASMGQPMYAHSDRPQAQTFLPPITTPALSQQQTNFPPLLDFLHRLSLAQYHHVFVAEGFVDVGTLCDITEDDFAAMNVKRGHRRVCPSRVYTVSLLILMIFYRRFKEKLHPCAVSTEAIR